MDHVCIIDDDDEDDDGDNDDEWWYTGSDEIEEYRRQCWHWKFDFTLPYMVASGTTLLYP